MSPSLLMNLLACTSSGGGSGGLDGDAALVVSLAIEPAEATISTSPDAAGTQDFEAIATFDDGTVEPIQLVSWELSNQAAGTIDGDGLFTASLENGAITTLTATHNGISADATLTVVYEETVNEEGLNASDFDGSPSGTVTWLYPPDGVAVPRNIPSLTFMWDAVAGADGYRLDFTTPTTAITVLTTENHWTAEADRWVTIAATNAGGEVLATVRAVSGGTISESETRTLKVNRLDAQGSIYYWSTTDNGVVKVPIAAQEGELYYAPEVNSPSCVACHVIREDRMGVTYQTGAASFRVGITDISGGTPVELTGMDTPGYYNTLNPTGTRMITTATGGGLNLWNAETGELIGAMDLDGAKLTQPDWSPEGDMLVAVQSNELSCDTCFSDGKIVVATIDDDGNLGPLTTLVDPVAVWGRDPFDRPTAYYPSFSPDGEWIAFNLGQMSSYDNDTSNVYVVSVDGGTPIELANANQELGLTNSWPHWGPLPDDDVYWLTWSSKRAYGDLVTDGRPQIWVTSFNPSLAAAGEDPSTPAFWLPNQDMETSNHTTFWGP